MGFKDARDRAIKALESGNVQHEVRGGEIDEKNLLQTGDVSPEDVVALLKRCRGTQHSSSPHHFDPEVDVHVFRPEVVVPGRKRAQRWYVKLYFVEPDAVFISVHR